MLRSLNHTIIILIPKVKNPTHVTHFRPISLCNVVYKIFSKVIANHLRPLMHIVISDHQSAFMPNRVIHQNILLGHEFIHYLKSKKEGKKGFLAFKLDMEKAYDRIEWQFLEEGLSLMLKNAGRIDLVQGVRIGRGVPSVSHMLFTDDAILFCQAEIDEASNLIGVLNHYSLLSGQRINFSKSGVFFSPNTDRYKRSQIRSILQVRDSGWANRYLGLRSMLQRSKTESFKFLLDKMEAKFKVIKGDFHSRAGREVMIKSVLAALPTFSLQSFRIPISTAKTISDKLRLFWWSGKMEGKYFSDSSFLESRCPSNASWGWRSIFAKKKILQRALLWRVGNGSSINIWKDNWLPDAFCPKVSSSLSNHPFQKVEKLLVQNRTSWNSVLIRQFFNTRYFNLIHQIPLSLSGEADRISWGPSPNGNFSVKSAYKFLRMGRAPTSSTLLQVMFKNEMACGKPFGELKFHVKFFSFSSNVVTNAFPSGLTFMLEVFKLILLVILVEKRRNQFAISFFAATYLSCNHTVELSNLGALLCWHIWKARNDGVFKNIRRDAAEVVSLAVSDLSEFHAISKFKIASLFFRHVSNVELAEALVLRESLKLAQAWGYSKVIFEGDCRSVMSLKPNSIFVSVVLEDIASILSVMEGCSLSWVPHSCNSVAPHSLAHRALKCRSSDLVWDVWPTWLLSSIQKDLGVV
ncbi:uncharacterized protein LOC132280905 [Cornus florida]|uniref:uncharacterized protein LOC132280905 n=1 Tax=Cornus florida TaxID=4283 RepID=UPI0028A06E74|nr:uncharacterized protein LOC132280905 [Cornus florida]